MARFRLKTVTNLADGIRRETFDGAPHIVFPAVLVVEGVLNNALVLASEMATVVESWNGRPIPVYHPTELGEPVSANSPDIISRSIGTVFNARIDGNKLKAELWINEQKADRLGYSMLISRMAAGEPVELSTGYMAKAEATAGEFAGQKYVEIHRGIQPDHVALLPDDVGACSLGDGCGAPRINNEGNGVKLNEKARGALKTLMASLGLTTNDCDCHTEGNMKKDELIAQAKALFANKAITAEQLAMLQKLDEEQMTMVGAILGALGKPKAAAETPPAATTPPAKTPEEEVVAKAQADAALAKQNAAAQTYTKAEVDALLAKAVQNAAAGAADAIKRTELVAKLKANKACAFTEAEMQAMSLESLTKYELGLRPADYSGQGGFGAGGHELQDADAPLVINSGLFAKKPQQKQQKTD